MQQRMCGSKRQFASKREASSRAHGIYLASGEQMQGYKCPYCGCFHIGHARGER